MALAALDKYMQAIAGLPVSSEDRSEDEEDEPAWLGPLIEIIETTVSTIPLSAALALSQFGSLLSAIPKKFSKHVSCALIDAMMTDDDSDPLLVKKRISDPATLTRFMTVIESLLYDTNGEPSPSKFDQEQERVCKVIHLFYADDTDVQFELLTTLRSYVGRGGPKRLAFTLPTLLSCAQQLVHRVRARELDPGTVSCKKVFQFIHNTCSALVSVAPEAAFRNWLTAGRIADAMEASFEPIAVEFFTQALITFEEEFTDSKSQVSGVTGLVGALMETRGLSAENYEALATKTTQHAARLLKKLDQCRAVLACTHLFWSKSLKDGKRVVECLQRSLKIADVCVQSAPTTAHGLFVECLNKYLYYYEAGLEDIAPAQLGNLAALCQEHAQFAASNPGVVTGKGTTAEEDPFGHLNQTIAYIKLKQRTEGSKLCLIRLPDIRPPQVKTTDELD